MSQLSIQGVSRTFTSEKGKSTQALLPVDFDVKENDFVTILGPSGCGKSTLLRIVAGLDHPTSGRVLLDGRPVEGPGADRGMVFQSYTLFPWLTIEQNIRFGLRERGMPESQQKERAQYFIAKVGLRGFEQHFPKQLSGGMQQRTAIARALANDPEVLLMDEPFGALDAFTREQMQELLLQVCRRTAKPVFLITHDIEEAVFLATDLILLAPNPGRIVERLTLDFGQRYNAGESARSIKSDPRFIETREHVLERVFSQRDATRRQERA